MPVWDVQTLPACDQFDYWREVICQAFVPLAPVQTTDRVGFAGRVETRPLGELTRATLSSAPQLTGHGLREVSATEGGWYFVNLQVAGTCGVTVDGRYSFVRPGQFVVVDTSRPFAFAPDQDWEMVSYRLPHSSLTPGGVQTGVAVDGSGAGGVVTALMQALWHVDAAHAGSADLVRALASAIQATSTGGTAASGRAELYAAVCTYLDQHLVDRDLSVGSVCRAFAVSPRTLHNLFAAHGTETFAATVRRRRLDRCAALLANPAVTTTITDMALGHGFDDPTSFARAFRRQHGLSPREARSGARDAACTNGTVALR